ncbi:MAG: pirin family protein [Bacteroidota bacterium]
MRTPLRKISSKLTAVGPDMHVLRPLPGPGLREVGPFIMLDHFGPESKPMGETADVPPHPHAGFQTVTYLYDGVGYHLDSQGGDQHIHPGGVNWMTAGKGIVHAERMSPGTSGQFEGFQIWVNLPAAHKDTNPGFEGYAPTELPLVQGEFGQVRVIAGAWEAYASPVKPFSQLLLWDLEVNSGQTVSLPIPPDYEVGAYIGKGNLQDLGKRGDLIIWDPSTEPIKLTAETNARIMVLAGVPLQEPVAAYGPFVMNHMTEIQAAIRSYQSGEMGDVPW